MSDIEQQVQFFMTPIGFAGQDRLRRLRQRVGRGQAAALLGWCAQIRDMAKLGKTFATFSTSVEGFAESMYEPIPPAGDEYEAWFEERARIWDAFDAVDYIDIIDGEVRDREFGFRVFVVDFHETNEARRPQKATRVTPDISRRSVVSLDGADSSAVWRENKRRVARGLPKMTDEERDQWVLTYRRDANDITTDVDMRIREETTLSPPAAQAARRDTGMSAVSQIAPHVPSNEAIVEADRLRNLNGRGATEADVA